MQHIKFAKWKQILNLLSKADVINDLHLAWPSNLIEQRKKQHFLGLNQETCFPIIKLI
jgi:hypothetical protein